VFVTPADSGPSSAIHDRWSQAADLQASRGYHEVRVSNGTLYALGGFLTGADSTMIEAYDPVGNSWSYKSPSGAGNQMQGAAVEADGTIYLVAGTVNGGTSFTGQIQAYDTVGDSWTLPTSMSPVRALNGAVVDSGKIYVIGGLVSATVIVNQLDIWMIGGGWSSGSVSGFTPVIEAAIVGLGGKIYVIGGSDISGATALALVQIYDIANDSWSTGSTLGFTPRLETGFAVVNGLIYVLGGATGPSTVTAAVEAYDPVADSWTTKASMPTVRYAFRAATLNGKIYAVGGTTIGGAGNYLKTVEVYTP
jgi:N-acetylneuraminic acid mutarotase